MIRERVLEVRSGLLMVALMLVILLACIALLIWSVHQESATGGVTTGILFLVAVLLAVGLFTGDPNQPKVLQFFGRYIGSAYEPGLRWANPFFTKKRISVRTRNFETGKLKVNDSDGNPVEIATVVVWKVIDTAEALFNVEDFEHFVQVQSEAALRSLATGYPYDAHQEGQESLSKNAVEISARLEVEIQERLAEAGVKVLEARISHLAYASEIAAAMLQRQQASAVVAARTKIVEGAVGMVEHALEALSQKEVIELDEERKAAMVSNLLVVLCSDRHTQPVVNTGSLY